MDGLVFPRLGNTSSDGWTGLSEGFRWTAWSFRGSETPLPMDGLAFPRLGNTSSDGRTGLSEGRRRAFLSIGPAQLNRMFPPSPKLRGTGRLEAPGSGPQAQNHDLAVPVPLRNRPSTQVPAECYRWPWFCPQFLGFVPRKIGVCPQFSGFCPWFLDLCPQKSKVCPWFSCVLSPEIRLCPQFSVSCHRHWHDTSSGTIT
jgi:hypothetical protein